MALIGGKTPRTARTLAGLNVRDATDGFVAWLFRPDQRTFYWFIDARDCFNYLLTIPYAQRNFFETIREGARQKPRFDIDIYEDELPPGLTAKIIVDDATFGIISTLAPFGMIPTNDEICIYSSSGVSKGRMKYSYHIVPVNYHHICHEDAKRFYDEVVKATHPRSRTYLDSKVYNSTQQFRAYGNTKAGEDRAKHRLIDLMNVSTLLPANSMRELKNEENEFYKSLLTVITETSKELSIAPRIHKELKSCETVEVDTIKNLIPPEFVYDKFYPNYGYRFNRRKNMRAECFICGREHDSNGAYVRVVDGMAYFRCFADDKKRLFSLGPVDGRDDDLNDDSTPTIDITQESSIIISSKNIVIQRSSDDSAVTTAVVLESSEERKILHDNEVRKKIFKRWDNLHDDY